jgi:hypothetical protein
MKHHFTGRERRAGFGDYPEVSLAEARRRRDEPRKSGAKRNWRWQTLRASSTTSPRLGWRPSELDRQQKLTKNQNT